MIEKDTNCSSINIKIKVVAKIKVMFKDFPRDTIRKTCAWLHGCFKAMVEAEGSYHSFLKQCHILFYI